MQNKTMFEIIDDLKDIDLATLKTPSAFDVFNEIFSKKEDDDQCPHDEHDHGICLDCEKDITNDLVGKAEAAFEGDR